MTLPEAASRPAGETRGEDLDEFALIDRLTALLPGVDDRPEIVVGIGDDAAVLDVGGPDLLVATTDAQVAGTHFRADWLAPEDVGWRALAVNASDVAAMGGRPHTALVSLVLPSGIEVAWLEGVYRGLAEAARAWGVAVVGGNVSRAAGRANGASAGGEAVYADPVAGLVIDLTVLGAVDRGHVLTRAGARPGDRVLVVGALGGAAAGRHLLAGDAPAAVVDQPVRAALVSRWRRPRARVAAARAIAATGLATSMIDVSDGFAADLGHVCDASGVGVRVAAARLPLATGVAQVATAMAGGAQGRPGLPLALGGGEDYALVLTARPADVGALRAALADARLVEVGEIVPAAEGRTLVSPDARDRPLPTAGWRHVG